MWMLSGLEDKMSDIRLGWDVAANMKIEGWNRTEEKSKSNIFSLSLEFASIKPTELNLIESLHI